MELGSLTRRPCTTVLLCGCCCTVATPISICRRWCSRHPSVADSRHTVLPVPVGLWGSRAGKKAGSWNGGAGQKGARCICILNWAGKPAGHARAPGIGTSSRDCGLSGSARHHVAASLTSSSAFCPCIQEKQMCMHHRW